MTVAAGSPCRNLEELLDTCDLDSLESLADHLAADLDCGDVIVSQDPDGGLEIILTGYGRGIGVRFPITLDEIWADLLDIEDEYWTPLHLESVREAVFEVEGFEVQIELDEDLDDDDLIAAINRRTTASGLVVQEPSTLEYPFTQPMSDSSTIAEWLDKRFRPNCRGCRVTYAGSPSDTLGDLRTTSHQSRRSGPP